MKLRVGRLLLLIAGLAFSSVAQATHILGGTISYKNLGLSGTKYTYEVEVSLIRDASADNTPNEVPFDNTITICAFKGTDSTFYESFNFSLTSKRYFIPVSDTHCHYFAQGAFQEGKYKLRISLPFNVKGYELKWERCCRRSMNNIADDVSSIPYQGFHVRCHLTVPDISNTSPKFIHLPVINICTGDTAKIDFDAADDDADSLSYAWEVARQGASINVPISDNCVGKYITPLTIDYNSGYSSAFPFGLSGFSAINAGNGQLRLYSKNPGVFALDIAVSEWRKGKLYSVTTMVGAVFVSDALHRGDTSYMNIDRVSTSEKTQSSIQIFPNPIKESLTISSASNEPLYYFIVNDMAQVITNGKFNGNAVLNTSKWSSGVYYISLKQGNKCEYKKIIKSAN
jgi:hypothetical protein